MRRGGGDNPDRGGPPKKINPETARRVLALFAEHKGVVALITILVLVSTALGLVQPILLQRIIDEGIAKRDYPLIVRDSLWSILAVLLANGLGIVYAGFSVLLGQRMMRGLRNRLFAHLQSMELAWFTRQKTGELQSRITNDVNGVQNVVSDTVSNIFAGASQVVISGITLLYLDWRLALLSFAIIPVFAFLSKKVGDWSGRIRRGVQERLATLNATTTESLSISGVLLTKVSGRADLQNERFRRENDDLTREQIRLGVVMRGFFTVFGLMLGLMPVLVYWLAGYLVIDRGDVGLSLGTLVAFASMQPRLFFPLTSLLNVHVEVASSLALFERIFEYLDLKPTITERPNALTLPPSEIKGRVAFETVSFRYDADAERDTLTDIDLVAEPGQLVALVGPSGAGKSTLTTLISRLYDPSQGRVTLDGRDLRDLSFATLANAIAVVTQETYLVHDSVRENVRYGRPDASDDEVMAACRAAAIHEVIEALPEGYDTVVGERGYRLSGGERQRVSIARAILKNPRVLILDEATSALDSESERRIQVALDQLMRGRTTFAVAHRLSTVMGADQIVVVVDGRIVERGTHAQLIARDGRYAELSRLQFGEASPVPVPEPA